jgi:2-phosphosulfolactate phosphatase
MHIELFLTPVPLARTKLEHKTAVVIDVLRSSTSICAALRSGAKGVIPMAGPGEAAEMWSKLGSDNAVLAGERGGVKIENFNYGNSPTEFTKETVGDKFVVMTTTNGTGIFAKTNGAALILSGAIVNISKVSEKVAMAGQDVVVICSGLEGGFSIEDTVCGGMLIHQLITVHKLEVTLNDAASLALLLYRTNKTAIRQAIQQGEHGKILASLGFAADVEIATEIDSLPVVPVLKDGRLVLDEPGVNS